MPRLLVKKREEIIAEYVFKKNRIKIFIGSRKGNDVVLADKNWVTSMYDGSLVMGNMMLAAHSLGLGSIWVHRAKEEFEQDTWKKLLADLGVKGEWEGIGHCAVGYIEGDKPNAAPRKDNRVFWIK